MPQSKSLRSRQRHRTRCRRLLPLFAIVGGMQLNIIWFAPSDANWKMIALPDGLSRLGSIVEQRIGGSSESSMPKKKKKKRYAYAFYATTSAYACGALVQVAQLRDLGTPTSIDFVLL